MVGAVEEAIVRLWDIGCPCGIPRSEADQLRSMAEWIVRRYTSIDRRRRRGTISSDARRSDLLRGLQDERQPHGGLTGVPKADVKCLADAALRALGHEIQEPRH